MFTQWATDYPSARFAVAALVPDGSDGEILGWGLALPEHVFAHLLALKLTGQFRTADNLIRLVGRSIDARLIWVDPEPEYWTDEPED